MWTSVDFKLQMFAERKMFKSFQRKLWSVTDHVTCWPSVFMVSGGFSCTEGRFYSLYRPDCPEARRRESTDLLPVSEIFDQTIFLHIFLAIWIEWTSEGSCQKCPTGARLSWPPRWNLLYAVCCQMFPGHILENKQTTRFFFYRSKPEVGQTFPEL